MPSFHQSLRQISCSHVLQMLAHERSWLAAVEVTKSIVIHMERKRLVIAVEEVNWLGVPCATIDGNAAGQAENIETISIYPVIRKAQESVIEDNKNKDGNGNKRKNRRTPDDSLKSGDVRENASVRSHFQTMEEFVAHEEIYLNGVFNVLSQVSYIHFRRHEEHSAF